MNPGEWGIVNGNFVQTNISFSIPSKSTVYLTSFVENGVMYDRSDYDGIWCSTNVNIGGYLCSLIEPDIKDFIEWEWAWNLSNYRFANLFSGNEHIIDASKLILPNITSSHCYDNMFRDCKSLINPPKLPATSLSDSCYYQMFRGCTSLETAPELPATNLANSCYANMFEYCSSLVNAPTLAATNLANACYQSMFSDCTSLVNAPELPATVLTESCYNSMFYRCRKLINAPVLPALTLAPYCYISMFSMCDNLSYLKALFIEVENGYWTASMLCDTAPTGTFVRNELATWRNEDVDIVPSGWTVETAVA